MNAAKQYAAQLANDLTKITMTEFFKNIHDQFYPDQDITFMDYFLELTEHEDEFVVHHSKLKEYGIMTSNQSNHIKEKFGTLNLVDGVDYRLTDVREPVAQGGVVTHKHYHLTPEAFKKCLMRAQRRAKQPVDPVIYCDYYLLLEKIFVLFCLYERLYAQKEIARLRAVIEQKSATIARQTTEHEELLDTMADMNAFSFSSLPPSDDEFEEYDYEEHDSDGWSS